MDVQVLRTAGGIAGLAGLSIGMILLLYREIIRKNIFPTLTAKDAYRLLRNVAVLSWSIAMFGILCWAWSTAMLHKPQAALTAAAGSEDTPVIAGTVVDLANNMGIGQAAITVAGQSSSATSEDSGNFRIVLPRKSDGPVRLSVVKDGYFKIDESVTPPAHALILQMRSRSK